MRLIDADALSELVKEPIDVFLSRLDLKCPPIIDLEPRWIPMSWSDFEGTDECMKEGQDG